MGSENAEIVVQTKLAVGAVDDPLEREADRVADRVVASLPELVARAEQAELANPPGASRIQRVQSSGSQRPGGATHATPPSDTRIQAKAATTVGVEGGEVDQDTERRITRARGGGRPLERTMRRSLETGFGADFSSVRVHTDNTANNLSERIQAKAFTTGSDIFFRSGEYRPGTRGGQRLLAHELTHVVQQGGAGVRRSPDTTPLVIQRWMGKSKNKGMQIGSPTNVIKNPDIAPELIVFTAGQQAPIALQENVTAFVVQANGVLSKAADRVVLEKDIEIASSKSGGQMAMARNPDGSDSSLVLGKSGDQYYAVPADVFKEIIPPRAMQEKAKKTKKRKKKAAKVANTGAAIVGLGGDVADHVESGRSLHQSGLAGALEKRDGANYTDMGAEDKEAYEKGIYSKKNFYDPDSAVAGEAIGTFGSWFSMISEMRSYHKDWSTMDKEAKWNAVEQMGSSVANTASASTNLVAQAQIAANKDDYASGALKQSGFGMRPVKTAGADGKIGVSKEQYQATDIEKGGMALSMITGGIDALRAVKKVIVDYVKWLKNISKFEKHGNLVREGGGVLKSFADAAKKGLGVAMNVKKFFTGASGVPKVVGPSFGLVLNAIEIFNRGLDIHRAKKDGVLVKANKKSLKERFADWWKGEKIDHKTMRAKRAQLQNVVDGAGEGESTAEIEEQIATIDEYLMDRDLANTSNKRQNRAAIAIIKEAQSVAANISTIAGQFHAAAGFKATSTATGYAFLGVRKLKQFARDHGAKGSNANKTTKMKNARYAEIAGRLYGDFVSVNQRFEQHLSTTTRSYEINSAMDFDFALGNEIDATADEDLKAIAADNAALKGRVKAAGLSWREFCAETDPAKRFAMLVSGQKKRE